jgi:hypothetical protein
MVEREEPNIGMQCPSRGCHSRHWKTFEAMHRPSGVMKIEADR